MNEWLQVKNLEMLVSKSELNLDINKNNDSLLFYCDLLNIARGRCDLIVKKTLNASIIQCIQNSPFYFGYYFGGWHKSWFNR